MHDNLRNFCRHLSAGLLPEPDQWLHVTYLRHVCWFCRLTSPTRPPRSFIDWCVGDFERRCQPLYKASCALSEEDKRSKRQILHRPVRRRPRAALPAVVRGAWRALRGRQAVEALALRAAAGASDSSTTNGHSNSAMRSRARCTSLVLTRCNPNLSTACTM